MPVKKLIIILTVLAEFSAVADAGERAARSVRICEDDSCVIDLNEDGLGAADIEISRDPDETGSSVVDVSEGRDDTAVDIRKETDIFETTDARVLWVADGDTLKVRIDGRTEMLRLLGIDTPESKKNDKCLKDAKRKKIKVSTILKNGERATCFTRGLVKKKDVVRVEFDKERRGEYNRLLAYVYLKDGRMLNEVIMRGGFAEPFSLPPNEKYEERLYRAYIEAKKNHRGLW